MNTEARRYKELRINALMKERDRLLAKGVPLHAPRMLKLANLVKRLHRELGQGELFEGAALTSGGGGDADAGDSTAAAGAAVPPQNTEKEERHG